MHYSVSDIKIMAENVEASKMFRFSSKSAINKPLSLSQVMTLMFISNGQGRHPVMGLHDYDLIDGKPAKKTDAMLRDFFLAGGKVEWHKLDDTGASATFSHPQGGSAKIDWDIPRAEKAGLFKKDMWQKWRRQMFRSRTISEGIRTIFPAATSGLYNTEEMADMNDTLSPVSAEPVEALEAACDRLAADVAISMNLDATYAAHTETFARMELEQPEWIALMQDLFFSRAAELNLPINQLKGQSND